MRFKPRNPLRTLLTGLITLLPLLATLLLLAWIWRFLAAWVGPGSATGRALTTIGLGVVTSDAGGYILGILILVACVYGLGLLVEAGLERGFTRGLDLLVQRIPVVRTVYDIITRLVALLSKSEGDGLKSMSPVWLYFGGRPADDAAPGTTVLLGLRSTSAPVMIEGKPFHAVLVPTAPVPVGGGLLYVPADWVVPADVGIEGVTSIYVSMGVTSGQYIGVGLGKQV